MAAYQIAGTPYGADYGADENNAFRWWDEWCEIRVCQQRAQELLDRHELNVALRREGLIED